jgi:hypothetical protein
VNSPGAIASWCIFWAIAATVAVTVGHGLSWRVSGRVLVIAAAFAWVGLWLHELVRVPRLLGFTPDGDLLMVPILAALVFWRLRDAGRQRAPSIALAGYAAVGLLGAIITVLPLGLMRFTPEQTVAHYLAHAAYAASQLPLLAITAKELWNPQARRGAVR